MHTLRNVIHRGVRLYFIAILQTTEDIPSDEPLDAYRSRGIVAVEFEDMTAKEADEFGFRVQAALTYGRAVMVLHDHRHAADPGYDRITPWRAG